MVNPNAFTDSPTPAEQAINQATDQPKIIPLHVIQSVNDPTYRKLIVKDGGLEVSLKLPPNGGPELVEYKGHMFDCYGREVQIHPSIKRIIREVGIGNCPSYRHLPQSVFLVERQDGLYSFAGVYYDVEKYGYNDHEDNPEVMLTAVHKVKQAELRYYNNTHVYNEFVSIDQHPFKDTLVAQALEDYGFSLWLGKHPDGRVSLLTYPYGEPSIFCYDDYDFNRRRFVSYGTFIRLKLSSDGTTLTAKMRAHATFEEDPVAASDLARYFTIVAQTTADAIRKAKTLHDNNAYEFRSHQIPFRVRCIISKK